MNFLLLNKIDTDLRRKVYEETRDGKIHRKAKISIYKDSEKEQKKTFEDYVKKENGKNKRKIIVEATKEIEPDIKIEAEKKTDKNILEYGSFLDVKK